MTIHPNSKNEPLGVDAGQQVPLHVANRQAARASEALRQRDEAAADAAALAVARVLKGGGEAQAPGRTARPAGKTAKG